MTHGVGGDFTDYSQTSNFLSKPNWSIQTYSTGALPHFEALDEFAQSYDDFLAEASQRMARSMSPAPPPRDSP
jgi:hypothetical protein